MKNKSALEPIAAQNFLNHLCDEELVLLSGGIAGGFLNHLCDEEPFSYFYW